MHKGFAAASALFATLVFGVACTVHNTQAPSVSGVSEFGLSLAVTATPDSISQDGASQSSIQVVARNANSSLMQGLALRIDMAVNGTIQDFGTLSARTIVTGSDGKAAVVYTAPPASPVGAGGSGGHVAIVVTPIGSNAQVSSPEFGPASIPTTVDIRLVPPGVILPPAGTPTATFILTPVPVNTNVSTTFDASASLPGQGAAQITSYVWNFGDGSATASGVSVSHKFTTTGTFTVTLTVTNDRGLSASTSLQVAVGTVSPPTATFVVSQTTPVVGQTVFFNGDASRAAPGHSIVQWSWDFGDGATANGGSLFSTSHAYSQSGTYTVVLSVLDETGQKGTTSVTLTVGSGNPVPSFTVSPGAPKVGSSVTFDASGTQVFGGATIVSYQWSFPAGVPNVSTNGPVTQTVYAGAGTFTVTLTVVDSVGRRATTSVQVTVTM